MYNLFGHLGSTIKKYKVTKLKFKKIFEGKVGNGPHQVAKTPKTVN